MKLIIDTHILLWWLTDDAKLTENARQYIIAPENDIYISHASLWEIQIKAIAGKLTAELEAIIRQLPENAFQQLDIDSSLALALGKLPTHHQDPFGRKRGAQTMHDPCIGIVRVVSTCY